MIYFLDIFIGNLWEPLDFKWTTPHYVIFQPSTGLIPGNICWVFMVNSTKVNKL
jgi:hypothetical protein